MPEPSRESLGGWAGRAGWCLVAAIVATGISIAVSGIFQAAALFCWGMDARDRGELRLAAPSFAWFLLAFAAAVLVSVIFSSDPLYSLWYLPKLLKFLLVPLMFTFMDTRRIVITIAGALAVITASAGYGLVQYYWLLDVNLLNRIRGFMSHWMTFSGQLMIAVIALSAWLLLKQKVESERRWVFWAWIALGVLFWALLLTYTRNAWMGAIFGLGAVLTFLNWRWLLPAGVVMLLLLILLPAEFQDRLRSSFDLSDETVEGRIELAETGARMIARNPFTGVGPMMVPLVARDYRVSQHFPLELYLHLHNSPLQIAAELGLPALLIWLALWGYLLFDLYRMSRTYPRRSRGYWLAVNGICLLIGFLVSGLLEYNYGDAELAILMLFFVTAPYVFKRDAPPA